MSCVIYDVTRRILFFFALFCLSASFSGAQNSDNIRLFTAGELVKYQRSKNGRNVDGQVFRKYGFKRIGLHEVLAKDDTRRVWRNEHVKANPDFDKTRQPLYRIFRRGALDAVAVIDHYDGGDSPVEVVFYWKQIYRRFADQQRKGGFVMSNSPTQTNCLQFRRPDYDIGVDFIIFEDVYIMKVFYLAE